MLSIIQSAGWTMWLLIIASITSLAIIIERFYSLRLSLVMPKALFDESVGTFRTQGLNHEFLKQLQGHSALGQVFTAAFRHIYAPRVVMKDAVEDQLHFISNEFSRFLTTLGTIAAMAPLVGLLGTVFGMIEVFGVQGEMNNDPKLLAHGISVALYNTAFGLIVALPSMMFYRHFRNRVEVLLVEMEALTLHLVEASLAPESDDKEKSTESLKTDIDTISQAQSELTV
jgi:biopolymer transport protein ExbB